MISGGGLHSFNELAGNGQSEHRGSESFLPSMGAFLGVRRAQWMWMWLLYQRVFLGYTLESFKDGEGKNDRKSRATNTNISYYKHDIYIYIHIIFQNHENK